MINKEELEELKNMRKSYKQALQIIKGIQITNTYKLAHTTKEELNKNKKLIEEQIKEIERKIKENGNKIK